MVNDTTLLRVDIETKILLDKIKIIPDETYDHVIRRLISKVK
jgi:hypothetical protein